MKNLNSEIRTKMEEVDGVRTFYVNDLPYNVTKTDGSVKLKPLQPDTINPSHYKQGDVECIDAIKAATTDGFTGYLTGNILKYVWRWKLKNGIEDLRKARWYLDRLIGELDNAGR